MKILNICLISFIIISSMMNFLMYKQDVNRVKKPKLSISFEVFYTMIIIYCIAIIGFGLIYFILSFYEYTLVVENGITENVSILNTLLKSFYFSGLTILTIGYGDITPLGFGRLVAIIQGLIGIVLPTAFILKLVHLNFAQMKDYH